MLSPLPSTVAKNRSRRRRSENFSESLKIRKFIFIYCVLFSLVAFLHSNESNNTRQDSKELRYSKVGHVHRNLQSPGVSYSLAVHCVPLYFRWLHLTLQWTKCNRNILPIFVLAQQYFTGMVEFGVIAQARGAFGHVLNGLSLIIHEFQGEFVNLIMLSVFSSLKLTSVLWFFKASLDLWPGLIGYFFSWKVRYVLSYCPIDLLFCSLISWKLSKSWTLIGQMRMQML